MTRVTQYALVLWVAISLNFALPRLMPGSPLELLAGTEAAALAADERASLIRDAGLDRPIATQYARYLGALGRGDLGHSYQRGVAVSALIAERLPWTLLLTVSSQVIAVCAGLALGALAAAHHGRRRDRLVLSAIVGTDALPSFWIGMLLVMGLAVELPLFPSFGASTPWRELHGAAWLADVARHLALPLVTLVMGSVAAPFLVARASLIAVLHEPYVLAARAKGLTAWAVHLRHALPNALLPMTTVGAMHVAAAFGGATLVETVFAYPGIGRLTYDAVLARDYPVIQGTFLVMTVAVLVANALVDLGHLWLDPRVRPGGPGDGSLP